MTNVFKAGLNKTSQKATKKMSLLILLQVISCPEKSYTENLRLA